MATAICTGDMRLLTGGREEIELEATSYRAALRELQGAYPGLTAEVFDRYSVAIDGVMIQSPLLETFGEHSELVFIPKIAGG